MILLEFTKCCTCRHGPRAVLGLEQWLTFLFVFRTEGLTIAVAGGVVLGIFAGLTMLITVFFHRHQYVITCQPRSSRESRAVLSKRLHSIRPVHDLLAMLL